MAKVTDIKTRSQKYWDDRAEFIARQAFKSGDALEREMASLFRGAYHDIDGQVQAFYTKYGIIAESPTFKTLADGTKVATGTAPKLVVSATVANKQLTRMTRLEKLEKTIRDILVASSKDQKLLMGEGLGAISSQAYYQTIYETYSGIGVGSSFSVLSDTTVRSLINNPINGQDWAKRAGINNAKLANLLDQTINNGIIQGLSNGEMSKRILENVKSGTTVANRLVRTEVTNSLNQATKLGYEESGVVKQYQYLATLDEDTSQVCEDLDGEIIDVDKAVTGLNFPPLHPNCRSTTIPYFDTTSKGLTRMARDLGGDSFTVPSDMDVKSFRQIYIDKTMTRADWDKSR